MLDHGHEFVHYHKGAIALYTLQEYIGEDVLNSVLASFVADKRFQQPPYTTTKELVTRIREATPNELQYHINDCFESITIHDIRVVSATYEPVDEGKYEVHLSFDCKKIRGDRSVNEVEVPVNDLIEVGVTDAIGSFIYLKKHWLNRTSGTIKLTVDRQPHQRASILACF